jgi:hypothetical protein
MIYPKQVQMGALTIPIYVVDQPIEYFINDGAEKSCAVGEADFLNIKTTLYHPKPINGIDNFIDAGGENFLHEKIEWANALGDLNLPHQTIKTLSTLLYQALSSGNVSFSKESPWGTSVN